jgi:hypothetical protein
LAAGNNKILEWDHDNDDDVIDGSDEDEHVVDDSHFCFLSQKQSNKMSAMDRQTHG